MKNLLFISAIDYNSPKTGGQNISKRNFEILKNLFLIDTWIPESKKIKKLEVLKNYLLGYSGGLNLRKEKEIIEMVKKKEYEYIFIDTSRYGQLVKKIKKINKKIKIITFYHNVEYFYILEEIKLEKTKIRKLMLKLKLLITFKNERLATKNSDYIFLLNERDNLQLSKLYKRSASLLLPVSFNDKFCIEKNEKNEEIDLLFVGSLFGPNYTGIKWFIEEVMSELKEKKLYVIGKNFENVKEELTRENVEIIGTVEELSKWYERAKIVVMPIFDGAGMKVKTAEALMYGKNILGTSEAFEGYEIEYNKVGGLCLNREEFINNIKNFNKPKYNFYSRKVFLEKYSNQRVIEKLNNFFEEEFKTKINKNIINKEKTRT